jgi:hypothetical protein
MMFSDSFISIEALKTDKDGRLQHLVQLKNDLIGC